MHRPARVQLGVAALAMAGVGLLGGCSPLQPVQAASSYTSHTICSETFISGLAPAQVHAETIATTPFYGLIDWLVSYHVDPIKREVSTTLAGGFFSRAVYRDGLDLERGNRLELLWLGGRVVELGRKLGVPTPTHGLMYALLKPYIMGTPAEPSCPAGLRRAAAVAMPPRKKSGHCVLPFTTRRETSCI